MQHTKCPLATAHSYPLTLACHAHVCTRTHAHARTRRVLQGDPAFYNLLSVYDLLFTNDADGNGVRPRPDYQARWSAAHEANMAAYNTSVIVGFFLGACAARTHHASAAGPLLEKQDSKILARETANLLPVLDLSTRS